MNKIYFKLEPINNDWVSIWSYMACLYNVLITLERLVYVKIVTVTVYHKMIIVGHNRVMSNDLKLAVFSHGGGGVENDFS